MWVIIGVGTSAATSIVRVCVCVLRMCWRVFLIRKVMQFHVISGVFGNLLDLQNRLQLHRFYAMLE